MGGGGRENASYHFARLLGSLCQAEPCEPEKTQFQTTTETDVEEPRAKQGLCKAEIKYKNVWVDKRGEMETNGEKKEMSQRTTTVVVKITVCGHYKKWRERERENLIQGQIYRHMYRSVTS